MIFFIVLYKCLFSDKRPWNSLHYYFLIINKIKICWNFVSNYSFFYKESDFCIASNLVLTWDLDNNINKGQN